MKKLFALKITVITFLLFIGLNSCASNSNVQTAAPVQAPEVTEENTEEQPQQAETSQETKHEETFEEKKARVEEEIRIKTVNMSEEQKKFYRIKRTFDYDVIGYDLDYKIMVNDEKKEIIIQYEESDSDEDWKNNYLFFPWPLKLDKKIIWTTYGFAKIYKSSKNIPLDEFYKQIQEHPDYKVIIWGWSLGSALAKITARHLIIRTSGEVMIDEFTTFGDVKCWYNPFYSIKKHCKKIREYVTPNDIITWCVPICRRDYKCKVGEKFKFKIETDREHYHTHYEDYDYSKWEDE